MTHTSARYSRKNIAQRDNHAAAFAKASTAPLRALTPAMLESIAGSHAKRGTPAFDRLLARLERAVAERHEREPV